MKLQDEKYLTNHIILKDSKEHKDIRMRKAVFRSKVKDLIAQKEAELGFQIIHSQISKATGINQSTVGLWMDDSKTFAQIDANILVRFMDYFKCDFQDLIEIIRSN